MKKWLLLVVLGMMYGPCEAVWINRASAPWNRLGDAELKSQAATMRAHPLAVVTAKHRLPPGGDAHDYMSFGPYWWPDPQKADGLPYIRRDGEVNPESRKDSDRVRLEALVTEVETLAAAAKRFNDHESGRDAVRRLKAFFLDPATAMRANLNFGQAIPGRCSGRGIGIIETRLLATELVDALLILEETGDLDAATLQGLKTWFAAYLDWLTTSPIGLDEEDEHNNHGTAYDLQVVVFAAFVGREEMARRVLRAVPQHRLVKQVKPDGSEPFELSRTRGLSYSTMNAELYGYLAVMGRRLGVDLWEYVSPEGQSVPKIIAWLEPYLAGTKPWPYKQITPVAKDAGRDLMEIRTRLSAPRPRP